MQELDNLRSRIEPLRLELLNHPIYQQIQDIDSLRVFMEHHIFAVWDFMSLLKAMQQQLCCINVPWTPNENSFACRLVNDIVMAEESDQDSQGGFASHYELYHDSMKQCGAETTIIDAFVDAVHQGQTVAQALALAGVNEPVSQFVTQTFDTIDAQDLCAITSAFTFGREDLLPDLFRKIVEELNEDSEGNVDLFRYYLDRHIHLDEEEHGPMTEKLMKDLCGSDEAKWHTAQQAAITALQARLNLWNSVSESLKANTK